MKPVFKYLIKSGSDYNSKDNYGNSCLDYAKQFSWRTGFVQMVEDTNIRDNLGNEDDLKKKIEFRNEVIIEDEEELRQLYQDVKDGIQRYPRDNEGIIYDSKVDLFKRYFELIRAKYSLGLACEELEENYKNMVPYVLDIGSKKIGYVNFIETFSLGILLEVPNEDLEKMVALADEEKLDDCLFDYLVKACGLERKYSSKGYQKEKPYRETEKIISAALKDKKAGAKELEQYMKKKWFQGHYDYEWKNAHKEYGYVGFWSFETGALAKILSLDDEALKNNNHYPYDLVHYKSGRQFYVSEQHTSSHVEEANKEEKKWIKMQEESFEQVIPNAFREKINQVIADYKTLDDISFWEKYYLEDVWYTGEMYEEENKNKQLLGNIIINLLIDEDYILQIDYKEELEDYREDLKNMWGDVPVKLVQFDLDNDQYYYALIPESSDIKNLYEVKILG